MPLPDPEAGTPADWLRHAASDLRLAELAAQDSQVLPAQAAFHAQQAVEKALKAVLVRLEVEFPRTHHLDELIALLGDAGVAWPFQPEQVEALTPYAVQSRYPGPTHPCPPPTCRRRLSWPARSWLGPKRPAGCLRPATRRGWLLSNPPVHPPEARHPPLNPRHPTLDAPSRP